ncbi:MAG TPA: hypothetical protein VL860_05280 [Planctomycetota bacterium]|nr:hypothetical protein [Planctomycetota bacterium]
MSADPVLLSIKDHRVHFRLANARLPFHFGMVTLREAWQMTLVVTVEDAQGRRAVGVAGDTLAPRWFDKDPAKPLSQNLVDLARATDWARAAFTAHDAPLPLFTRWQEAYHATLEKSRAEKLPDLVGSYGASVWERALWSALARLTQQPFHMVLRENWGGVDLAALHPELAGIAPSDILPGQPPRRIFLRHTVGGADPLTRADDCSADPKDSRPYTLDENIRQFGLRYFKLKIFGDVAKDFARLQAIARVLDQTVPLDHRSANSTASVGPRYHVTIDGNESYREFAAVEELVARLKADPALEQFRQNILFIEQPLHRDVSFDPANAPALARLTSFKRVIIDEADQNLDSWRRAAELGYGGVSAKNCKGVIKSIANKALMQVFRQEKTRYPGGPFVQSGEDLTNLPVVPLQQDLTTLAALGIPHAERNGHHFYAGASHLSAAERAAAQQAHRSLYESHGDKLFVAVHDGQLDLHSLQQPGYGLAPQLERLSENPPGTLDRTAWLAQMKGQP